MTCKNNDVKDKFLDAKDYLTKIEKIHEFLSTETIDRELRKFAEFNITSIMIIRTTGFIEKIFSSIILEFTKHMSSEIFHTYFENHFIKSGKNLDTNKMNNLFKSIDVDVIKKSSVRSKAILFESLDSIYSSRNSLSHGDSVNVTFDDSLVTSKNAIKFIEQDVITTLDKKLESISS